MGNATSILLLVNFRNTPGNFNRDYFELILNLTSIFARHPGLKELIVFTLNSINDCLRINCTAVCIRIEGIKGYDI